MLHPSDDAAPTGTLLRHARVVPLDGPGVGAGGADRSDHGAVGAVGGRSASSPAAGADRPVDVRIRDGLVVEVGTDLAPADGSGGAGGRDVVVDLEGRWLLPGLWDAHVHMTQWALSRRRLDVSGASSAGEVAALVRERLREDPPPPGLPLVGVGFRDALWTDVPTSVLLDDAAHDAGVPSAVVVLVSGDLHCGWLGGPAARTYGVDGLVGADGTGLLREAPWFALMDRLGEAPDDVTDAWVADAARAAAARGVVGVVDYEAASDVEVWRRRVTGGFDLLRVEAAVWPDRLDAALRRGLRTGEPAPGTGGLVTMGALKVISDGSLNTRTAYCHDPYPGLRGPDAHGVMSVPPEELEPLMARAAAGGLRCAIHAIGDRANTLVLDAFTQTGARGSVEHAQLLTWADVARFRDLGVVASVQPEHAMDDRDVADRHWSGRTGRAFAFRALHDAGVRLVLGSDAPVAPLDPWFAVASAVGRSRDGREPWHPEQALPLAVALAASVRSRVAVGEVADLAVLDADPVAVDVVALRTLPVAATLLGGRWTHRTF
ncbi:amidohydrolase [Actinotalea subterranea]|uniref:amidohydrolase n=1 Tax=Actinotalea subterranea TaxID=2607497 RepID=UPI001FEAF9D7|nr:amidohydrolase family protein [Actinotalea subterranea]